MEVMKMRIRPVAAFLMAGTAASVALAPIAQAAPNAGQHNAPAPQICTTTNAGSECVSPGNVQINDAPPFVNNFSMYGMFPWIL
jgi:hypothetical protein